MKLNSARRGDRLPRLQRLASGGTLVLGWAYVKLANGAVGTATSQAVARVPPAWSIVPLAAARLQRGIACSVIYDTVCIALKDECGDLTNKYELHCTLAK